MAVSIHQIFLPTAGPSLGDPSLGDPSVGDPSVELHKEDVYIISMVRTFGHHMMSIFEHDMVLIVSHKAYSGIEAAFRNSLVCLPLLEAVAGFGSVGTRWKPLFQKRRSAKY